jgi:hypothetical protein
MYNTIEYSKNVVENELFNKLHRLMKEKENALLNGENSFYSLDAHRLIQERYAYGVGYLKSNIILPVPKEKLDQSPSCVEFQKRYFAGYSWPKESFYQYGYDLCSDNAPGYLYFGYALCQNELFPCAFFVALLMTMEIERCPGEFFPEEFAIDFIGLVSGKNPECYIGIMVPTEEVENWITSSGKTIFPLEYLVEKNRKESFDAKEWEKEILFGQQEALKNTSDENKKIVTQWLCSNH